MNTADMLFHGNTNRTEIAITFDDGPAEETQKVLEVLGKYNVRATFFIVGKMVPGRENILQKTKEAGHEFGNHTYSHKRLWFKSKKFIEEDIKRCDAELARIGVTTNLFRFPGFQYTKAGLKICKKLNKEPIFADMSLGFASYDWLLPLLRKWGLVKNVRVERVVRNTILKTRSGSILVFHDYLQEIGPHPELTNILGQVIPGLLSQGYKFVTISELITNVN